MHLLQLQLCTLLIGVWLCQAAKLHNKMTADELARLLGSRSLDEIPDYDLVSPFQVDEHGSFHSNDLSTIHLRTRRSDYHLVKDVPAHFKVPAFGDVHHLAVSPNNELLSPGFLLQVHLENGKIDTHYEYTHSQYVGTVRGDEDSHVAISNHGGNLMGVIITANMTLMLQPLPDHHSIGSVANPDNHTHIVYRRQANDALTTRPYGRARGCDVNESIPAEDYQEAQRGEYLPGGKLQTLASGLDQQYVVEAIVVGDKELLRKWNYNVNNVKYYIITLMNIASSMYNRDKLGYDVRLVLTRIAIFQSENAQRDQRLYISQNSKTTLESFCDWQARTKPEANSRLAYDHAFLFTGYGLCFGRNEDCWELGRAWVQGMCRDKYACSVNAEKGMQLGFVFAHELGHNLGMSHDGANGRCRAENGYVMKSSTGLAQNIYLWSSCSKNYLLSYL
ncbi:A disintegrin and metalloproteinase with thrombospondin motifs 18-like, partial [Oscarella lobularis]|uniref:A disintegrin and metalloproteinase with thrombospondin motifs 18-like n=1 Tax=Oscarella lobularis TaxID=121494 RepID=UPI00331328CA